MQKKTKKSGVEPILLLHPISISNHKDFPFERHEARCKFEKLDEARCKFDIVKKNNNIFLQMNRSKPNQLFLTSVSWTLTGQEGKLNLSHNSEGRLSEPWII